MTAPTFSPAGDAGASPHAIEFRDYSFRYAGGDRPVLEHCNLTMDHGEFVLLSGLSGEGKSTLMASIDGIIPNYFPGDATGDILLDGVSVMGRRIADLSRQVGSVLQDADDQIVHAKVADEIAFACECISMEPARIGERISSSCKLMHLDPEGVTATLSGGQKQRLVTATTLAMGQGIVLLDEPLANLDVDGARMLLDVLRRKADEGAAILIVEHRYDLVMPFVDRILRIRNRHVEEAVCKQAFAAEMDVHLPASVRRPSSAADEAIAALSGVSCSVGGKTILKDIDLTLCHGERIVVLGQNGCGKTTLLRLLAGLIKPGTGAYRQNMMPARKVGSPAWFGKVGYVCQNPDYQLFMPSVRRELSYRAADSDAVARVAGEFSLDGLLDRHPQSLSEGQKRRLSIAVAIAKEPELLLLDEPTVGQDIGGLMAIAKALDELERDKGTSTVIVTHDMRLAKAIAGRVVVMRDGRIVADGGTEEADRCFSGCFDRGASAS